MNDPVVNHVNHPKYQTTLSAALDDCANNGAYEATHKVDGVIEFSVKIVMLLYKKGLLTKEEIMENLLDDGFQFGEEEYKECQGGLRDEAW